MAAIRSRRRRRNTPRTLRAGKPNGPNWSRKSDWSLTKKTQQSVCKREAHERYRRQRHCWYLASGQDAGAQRRRRGDAPALWRKAARTGGVLSRQTHDVGVVRRAQRIAAGRGGAGIQFVLRQLRV